MRNALIAVTLILSNTVPRLALAQDAASYCSPPVGTRLVYDQRVRTVLATDGLTQKLHSEPANQDTEVIGHVLFRNPTAPWEYTRNADGINGFWPIKVGNIDNFAMKTTKKQNENVTQTVLGTEDVTLPLGTFKTWKIELKEVVDNGNEYKHLTWYSPELCAPAAFSDAGRVLKLMRIIKPTDADYSRRIIVKDDRTSWADTGEPVK